jgi:hypothetical protein
MAGGALVGNFSVITSADAAADPREQLGITLDADTTFCENCHWIGLPLDGVCRKCASASLTQLAGALMRQPEQESN